MLTWNVLYHDSNKGMIEVYNIFEHSGFYRDVCSHRKLCKVKEKFADKLKGSLFYYFCCKSEWELLVQPWCGGGKCRPVKIDVYNQVMFNWDIFLDYVWENRKLLT